MRPRRSLSRSVGPKGGGLPLSHFIEIKAYGDPARLTTDAAAPYAAGDAPSSRAEPMWRFGIMTTRILSQNAGAATKVRLASKRHRRPLRSEANLAWSYVKQRSVPMLDEDGSDCAAGLPDGAPVKAGAVAVRARGRGRLGGAFAEAVQADFEAHGAVVVARIREEKPESYLKLVASILPKNLDAAAGGMGELSDEQLIERIRLLDAAIRPLLGARKVGARRSVRRARSTRSVKERPSE